MGKDIISEDMPIQETVRVSFPQELFNLAFENEANEISDDVDRFWNGLYIAQLPNQVRNFITNEDVTILGIEVTPANYDVETGSVCVLLTSAWFIPEHKGTRKGHPIYLWLNSNGTFTTEKNSNQLPYSRTMTWHVEQLLGYSALAYPSSSSLI